MLYSVASLIILLLLIIMLFTVHTARCTIMKTRQNTNNNTKFKLYFRASNSDSVNSRAEHQFRWAAAKPGKSFLLAYQNFSQPYFMTNIINIYSSVVYFLIIVSTHTHTNAHSILCIIEPYSYLFLCA